MAVPTVGVLSLQSVSSTLLKVNMSLATVGIISHSPFNPTIPGLIGSAVIWQQ